MKRITINALVDLGCLIMFIPSLVSKLVLYVVYRKAADGAAAGHYSLVSPVTNG